MSRQQYGPIGVQAYPGEAAVSTPQQNMALPLSASNQAELLEWLKQLRAWQQKQQADLLRQQQEQLFRLKSEQQTAMREKAQSGTSTGVGEVRGDGQVRVGEEGGGGFERILSLSESSSSVSEGQGVSGAGLAERIEYGGDKVHVDDPGGHFDSPGCENRGETGPGSDSEEATNFSRVSTL